MKPLTIKTILRRAFCLSFVLMSAFGICKAKEDYSQTYNLMRAKEEVEKGNYAEAKEFLDKEISSHPDNGLAYTLLAVIHYGNKNYDEVFPNFDKAMKYLPKKDKEKRAKAYLLRGNTFLAMGDTIRALEDMNQSITLDPEESMGYEDRGNLLYYMNRYDDSDKDYETLRSRNPGDAQPLMGLGRNENARGNYENAIKYYDQVVNMYPDFGAAYAFRGESKLNNKKYSEAADDLVKALELSGDNLALYEIQQFPKEQVKLVAAKLKGMAVRNPYEPQWYYILGRIYDDKKLYEEAIDAYLKGYEIDAHPVFTTSVSKCYSELGAFRSALNYINQSIGMNPDDESNLLYKGYYQIEDNDFDEGIATYSEFIDRVPDDYTGYYCRAFAKNMSGRLDEALEDYDMAIALNPDYTYAYFEKADILKQKGNTTEAKELYNKVVELDTVPNNDSCAMYALLALDRKEDAIAFMDDMLAQDPDDSGNYYDAACFYSRMGDYDKSFQYLNQAFEKGFRRLNHIMRDDDLEEVRKTDAFRQLFEEYVSKVDDAIEVGVVEEVGYEPIDGITPSDLMSAKVEIPFTPEYGTVSVKCSINDLPLNFVFDTGASDVSMSQVEATFMLKNGYLKKEDIIGKERYMNANGEISVGTVVNLRNVDFGGLHLENVRASIVDNQKAPLLLGQSVLGRLGTIEIDNVGKKLIITKH